MTSNRHLVSPPSYDADAPGEDVFDPALRHYSNGLRKGDPPFEEETQRERWSRARERALVELVARIALSELADRLVLRGGLAVRAWFGAAARDPKDADFVVVPPSVGADDRDGRRLIARVVELASAPLQAGPLSLRLESPSVESIWTYERAEGRRVVVPFRAGLDEPSFPGGTLQIDLVFGEPLRDRPGVLVLQCPGSSPVRVLAATMRESLAWKLLWLVTDWSPQGKDLYDALLLAEALMAEGPDPGLAQLIGEVVNSGMPLHSQPIRGWEEDLRRALELVVSEWRHFKVDYRHLAHLDPRSLGDRLVSALRLAPSQP
jgi:hypothetical protein